MRVNSINLSPNFKTAANELSHDEYNARLKKRANDVSKTLLISSGIATAAYFYAAVKCKDKGGLFKVLWNKISGIFGKKTN